MESSLGMAHNRGSAAWGRHDEVLLGFDSSRSRGRGRAGNIPRKETEMRKGFDPANVLKVNTSSYYATASEVLQKPQVLGSYSVDSERNYGWDKSMLHFLLPEYTLEDEIKKVNIDLNKGCSKFKCYNGNVSESFHNMLKWILENQSSIADESSQRLTVDFVGLRGSFSKIMKSPHNWMTWTIYATEYKGTVYLMKWNKEEDTWKENALIEDIIAKWGHTFEHIVKGGEPDAVLDSNEEYRCVVKTRLGEMSLLYAPKIDCADPQQYKEDFEDLDAFVSIKCCKELQNPHKERNFRKFKLNIWWMENQLSGIPRTIVGFRDDDGIVHTMKQLRTDELPNMCEGEWEPNACFNFLQSFLTFVKSRVSKEPGTTFIFKREAQGHIYCTKLSDKDHINLLPTWYTTGLFAEKE